MSSSGLTLDRLQSFLIEHGDFATEKGQPNERAKRNHAVEKAAERVYQAHGMMTPMTGLPFKRPVSMDLFRCPLSSPPTTLVLWDSLPRAIQERLQGDETTQGRFLGQVVEVPRSFLMAPEIGELPQQPESRTPTAAAANALQNRPLGGNMTNKLTEYTRGTTGQCRPFRPGGLGNSVPHESSSSSSSPALLLDLDTFLSPESIEQSRRVLEQGSKQSWMDGILLTAPPGVDFQVGLSYDDVHGSDPHGQGRNNQNNSAEPPGNEQKEEVVDDYASDSLYHETSTPTVKVLSAPAVMWDRSFLDDDSLFGSSSSSGDESDGEEDDKDGAVKEPDDGSDDSVEAKEGASKNASLSKENEVYALEKDLGASGAVLPEEDDAGIDVADVDALLAELSRAEAGTKKEVIIPQNTPLDPNNPLHLAERQAQLQNNTTRKSWANTNLLPIDDFNSWIPNPAMTYPFTLDTFQQQAVARLERSESVFVAAHTSAGKTVVAEYACALAKQRGARCIYTSPIKALSNQKFRDFCTKFGSENVGLITGDMQLNVDDSTCLIMTTEILRSMLYRGADLIRDIEWVIFDEVHYVNDTERGVVWEEVIIMLPSYVNLIFLSATTPNTLEFSDWIGRTKRKPVHVIKTDYRPVPLSHYLWANLKLHKLMEGKSGFLDKGYREAGIALKPKEAANQKGTTAKGQKTPAPTSRGGAKHMAWQQQGSKQNWMSLVRFLEREELTPTVIFSFSKKKCEEIADMLRSLDLNTAAERSAVQGFTLQTVARLSPVDAVLPQVVTVCEMVKRGIGVHHGGLLPILKEMVEILFSRNLIKILFATETFAMGVNMPARAVVFNSIRKHDGTQFRVLEPGEYTQMAGRAGRRGLDKVGTVIMCCFGDEPPPIPLLRNMLTGSSTMLRSQFRLTYNMILNLLRVEEMSVESMIKRSFSEFATQRALAANEYPKLLARGKKTLAKLEDQFKLEASQRVGADDLEDYFVTCSELVSTNRALLSFISESVGESGDAALQQGRIILVSAARKYGLVHAPAIVLQAPSSPGASDASMAHIYLVCMVLLPESYVYQDEPGGGGGEARPAGTIGHIGSSNRRHYAIYELPLDNVLVVSATKRKIDAGLLFKKNAEKNALPGFSAHVAASFFPSKPTAGGFDNPFSGMKARGKSKLDEDDPGKGKRGVNAEAEAVEKAMEALLEAEKEESGDGIPVMDLRDFVKRGSEVVEFRRHCTVALELVAQMRQYSSHRHPAIGKYFSILDRQRTLKERVDALQHLLSNESLSLFPDFLQRKAVLRSLGYLDQSETVCVKGRVACEVSTCEELIVTEMVFEGILNDLEPTEIVAALSALVYQQKSDDSEFDMEIPETLLACCQRMKTVATNLGQLQKEHGLEIDPADYCDASLKFGLVHVVYEWALGVPFRDICDLTTAQEGSIVRCITRLDELCREVRNCARVVGNPTLYRKMEAASVAIKRDIVFASSLYVS